MAAAVGVEEVLRRGIVRLIGGLNAALGHHCVCVADAQLCYKQHSCAGVIRFDGGRAAGAAAAENQDVAVIIGF